MELNKENLKEFCEFIQKELKEKKVVSFSDWHSKPYAAKTPIVAALYKKARTFTFNSQEYLITFSAATSGMGGQSQGSPDDYTITKFNESDSLDVDELLSKREITIRHFHGGVAKDFEEPIPLDNVDDILRIVKYYYEETKLNVMVHRQSTGDVTVWLDDKRFTQR